MNDDAELQQAHYDSVEKIVIVDCRNCRRCTVPSSEHPNGICMAFNQAPAYVYERCLKCGTFVPKEQKIA